FGKRTTSPELVLQQLAGIPRKNTKRTRVKRHQPVRFSCQDSLRPRSPENSWWSWRRELNPRPSDYKSDALPAELRQRRSNRVRIADEARGLQAPVDLAEHEQCHRCGKQFGSFQRSARNKLPIFRYLPQGRRFRSAFAATRCANLQISF